MISSFQIILILSSCTLVYCLTDYRAGLLFEETGTYVVNGNSILYRRNTNTSSLIKAATHTADMTLLYNQLCNNIKKLLQPQPKVEVQVIVPQITYKPTPYKYARKDAKRACKLMGGRLPEIRGEQSKKDVAMAMLLNDIQSAVAGIRFDKQADHHRYLSDDSFMGLGMFPNPQYGGYYTDSYYKATSWTDSWITPMFDQYSMMYVDPGAQFNIRLMDKNNNEFHTKILCEFPPEIPRFRKEIEHSENTLFRLALHNCERDVTTITQTTAFTLREVEAITQLDISAENRQEPHFRDFFPTIKDYDSDNKTKTALQMTLELEKDDIRKSIKDHVTLKDYLNYSNRGKITSIKNRKQRDLSDITIDPIISDSISESSGSNNAPLAFVGNIMENVFGVVTRRTAVTMDKLIPITKAIEDLAVNQGMMGALLNNVLDRSQYFESRVNAITDGNVALSMVSDIKEHIKHLQTTLQITMAKYANILLASAVEKTSPYALQPAEIRKMSKALPPNQWLTEELSEIKSEIIVHNNTLTIVFEIPVISEEDKYNFYKVIPIPTFKDNSRHTPITDMKHIAISKSGERYIALSDDEFQYCLNNPTKCIAHTPTMILNEHAGCVVATYTTNKQQCFKHKSSTDLTPFFYKQQKQIFYSVNEPTNVYIRCLENADDQKYADKSIIIETQGQLELRPSCSLTMTNGITIKSRMLTSTIDLAELPILDHLNYEIDQKVELETPPPIFTELPKLKLNEIILPSFEDFITDTFHPQNFFPAIVRIIFWTALIGTIIFVVYKCYPKIKSVIETNQQKELTRTQGMYAVNDPKNSHNNYQESDTTSIVTASTLHVERERGNRIGRESSIIRSDPIDIPRSDRTYIIDDGRETPPPTVHRVY